MITAPCIMTLFFCHLPTMSQTDYLRHFASFLETRPAFTAKEFNVNTPFGIMHYQPGQTTQGLPES